MNVHRHRPHILLAVLLAASAPVGCVTGPRNTSNPVGSSLQERAHADAGLEHDAGPHPGLALRDGGEPEGDAQSGRAEAVAHVNGHPIMRHRVVDLLLRAQGVGMLEQLVVLDEAERLSARRGLFITQADIVRENEIALRKLSDPFWPASEGPFDRETAQRTLDAVLAERNISGREFQIAMRRQAYLRKIVEAEQSFDEADLQREYDLQYGPQLLVRHIQLASPREAARVLRSLSAGEPFEELARTYSANTSSGEEGGTLEPFSPKDESVPAPFRNAADALQVGETSDPVRVGEWYQLIRLEKRIPARDADFQAVRQELIAGIRRRTTDAQMQKLYERLFREAKIEIVDPVLRQAFQRVHKDRTGSN